MEKNKEQSRYHPFQFIIPLLLFGFTACNTVTAQHVMGATSVAMGQTGVAVPASNWAVFSNVALMSTERHTLSFYGFRYVGIAEITDMAAAATIRSRFGSFGAGIHRYGFNLFHESRFLFGYKNSQGAFHYGLSASYNHISQGGDYGSAGAFGIHAGIAAAVTDYLWFGTRATNLNQPTYGTSDEKLPGELAVGAGWQMTSSAFLTAELVKDVLFPLSFRTGLQFELVRSLFARAGFTTNPETYSFGFGYLSESWEINFGLQQHNPLGLSPGLDLTLRF